MASPHAKTVEVYTVPGVSVGAIDLMTCDIVPEYGEKTLGIYARIYYPTAFDDDSEQHTILGVEDHPEEYSDGITSVFLAVPAVGRLLKYYAKSRLNKWNSRLKYPVKMGALMLDSDGIRPLVILNPGYTGCRWGYNELCCALVAAGCIAVVIEPACGTAGWTWRQTEKHIPLRKPDGINFENDPKFYELYWTALQGILLTHKSDLTQSTVKNAERGKELLRTIQLLEQINQGQLSMDELHVGADFDWTQFKGKLDVDNIALLGHSQGMPVMLEAMVTEGTPTKIKCAVGLDGTFMWHRKHEMEPIWKLQTPVFHIQASKPLVRKNHERHLDTVNKNPAKTQMAVIQGATHTTFCDSNLMPKWAGGSKVDFVLANKIVATLTVQLLKAAKELGHAFSMENFPPKEFMEEFGNVFFVPLTEQLERKLDRNYVPYP